MPNPSPNAMPSGAVTIRGLTPELKAQLRVRAAHHGRSMEAEARAILEAALAASEEDPTDLAAFARGLFAPLGGAELELPDREFVRDPPGFRTGAPEAAPAPAASVARKSASPKGRARAGKAPPPGGGGRRR